MVVPSAFCLGFLPILAMLEYFPSLNFLAESAESVTIHFPFSFALGFSFTSTASSSR